jgi:hypothetical protein
MQLLLNSRARDETSLRQLTNEIIEFRQRLMVVFRLIGLSLRALKQRFR